MGPWIMLLARRKSLMDREAPKLEGIVPCSVFDEISNHERNGKSPKPDGMVPVK